MKWSVILGPSREVLDSKPLSRAVLHRSDDPEIWVTVTSERPAEGVDLLQEQRRAAAWNLKVDTVSAPPVVTFPGPSTPALLTRI